MSNMQVPAAARPLVAALNKYSRMEDKNTPVETQAERAITGDGAKPKPRNK